MSSPGSTRMFIARPFSKVCRLCPAYDIVTAQTSRPVGRDRMKSAVRWLSAVCILNLVYDNVQAQSKDSLDAYPARPVRLIVPYPPGGGNDTLARLFGQKLTESWGQQVVVDNRPGAGTIIGTQLAARAVPDGYTLLLSSIATHAVAPNLYRNPGYDPVKDFTPMTLLAIAPTVLCVNPSVPARSVQELIALAQGEARGAQVRVRRQRHAAAHGRRDLREHDGHQAAARSLQRRRAGDRRADRRGDEHDVRYGRVDPAARQRREAARARDRPRRAPAGVSRSADFHRGRVSRATKSMRGTRCMRRPACRARS